MNLPIPEHSDISIKDAFINIQDWACHNRTVINHSKTKEIDFHRPHPDKLQPLPSIDNVQIARDAKLLGILLNDNLSFDKHVNAVLAACSQQFYVLKMLRDGRMPLMPAEKFNVLFCELVVNHLS